MKEIYRVLASLVGGVLAYIIIGGVGLALLGTAIGIPAIGVGAIVAFFIWLLLRAVRK